MAAKYYLYDMYKVKVNDHLFKAEKDSDSFSFDGDLFDADIIEFGKGKFHILSNNRSFTAEVLEADPIEKTFSVKVNHSIYIVNVKDRYDELLEKMGIDVAGTKKVNDIKAPMPGMVLVGTLGNVAAVDHLDVVRPHAAVEV